MRIGCFFGSFNPIHCGHLIIAEYMANYTDLQVVQFIVSPLNPLKQRSELTDAHHRLNMVQLAVSDNPSLTVNTVEFDLPVPSFTIDTLRTLADQNPHDDFIPIIGGDNLVQLPLWKSWEEILDKFGCYVYQRPGYPSLSGVIHHPGVRVFNTPLIDLSATYIRDQLVNSRSVRYLVPDRVIAYINEHQLYGIQ